MIPLGILLRASVLISSIAIAARFSPSTYLTPEMRHRRSPERGRCAMSTLNYRGRYRLNLRRSHQNLPSVAESGLGQTPKVEGACPRPD